MPKQAKKKPKSTTKPKSLSAWKTWCDYVRKQHKDDSNSAFNTKLNRANARFALASGFKGISLEGYTDKSRLGYEAVLRLLLAYTAAETLAGAMGSKVTRWKITDKKLAERLRPIFYAPLPELEEGFDPEVVKLRPLLLSLYEGPRKDLESFMLEKNDNVMIAAKVLRHLMAHGVLTLNGLELKTLRLIKAINSLSDTLLKQCDEEFTLWLEKSGIA